SKEVQKFSFKLNEEKNSNIHPVSSVKKYLYEPNTSILKAGAFKLLSHKYNIEKLHLHSHLYTSDNYIEDFPGRIFEVEKIYESSRHTLKQLEKEIPQANITARNFPMTVAEIRKRTRIKEGGNKFLFATTLADNTKIFILSQKA
ncbi:MAG: SAM-dependent methyltransferase, partial [Odoribacter sp.]|nr:SAM-dependent methyltransferase [Odoribacter sp.]